MMKDYFRTFQLKLRPVVIMKLNKGAHTVSCRSVLPVDLCWPSVSEHVSAPSDATDHCCHEIHSLQRDTVKESQLDELGNKKWAIHIIRLCSTSEKYHVPGDGVAKEIHRTHVYIHYWRHDNSKTDVPEVFWEALFFFFLFFGGIFIPSTSFTAPSCAAFNFNFLADIFRTERKAHVVIVPENTPLYSIITGGQWAQMSPSQGPYLIFKNITEDTVYTVAIQQWILKQTWEGL